LSSSLFFSTVDVSLNTSPEVRELVASTLDRAVRPPDDEVHDEQVVAAAVAAQGRRRDTRSVVQSVSRRARMLSSRPSRDRVDAVPTVGPLVSRALSLGSVRRDETATVME